MYDNLRERLIRYAKASKLRTGEGGSLLSARNKSGMSECSSAASKLARREASSEDQKTLARCRAASKQNRSAELKQASGKLAPGRGTYQRSESAKALKAQRTPAKAAPKARTPKSRETAAKVQRIQQRVAEVQAGAARNPGDEKLARLLAAFRGRDVQARTIAGRPPEQQGLYARLRDRRLSREQEAPQQPERPARGTPERNERARELREDRELALPRIAEGSGSGQVLRGRPGPQRQSDRESALRLDQPDAATVKAREESRRERERLLLDYLQRHGVLKPKPTREPIPRRSEADVKAEQERKAKRQGTAERLRQVHAAEVSSPKGQTRIAEQRARAAERERENRPLFGYQAPARKSLREQAAEHRATKGSYLDRLRVLREKLGAHQLRPQAAWTRAGNTSRQGPRRGTGYGQAMYEQAIRRGRRDRVGAALRQILAQLKSA